MFATLQHVTFLRGSIVTRSCWFLTLAAIVLVLAASLVMLLRRQAVSEKALRGIRRQLESLLRTALSTLWYITCYLYHVWWGFSLRLRQVITGSALVVLIGATFWFIAEGVVTLFGRELFRTELPFLFKLLVMVLALPMLRHRYDEWKRQKERWKLASA